LDHLLTYETEDTSVASVLNLLVPVAANGCLPQLLPLIIECMEEGRGMAFIAACLQDNQIRLNEERLDQLLSAN